MTIIDPNGARAAFPKIATCAFPNRASLHRESHHNRCKRNVRAIVRLFDGLGNYSRDPSTPLRM